MNADTSSTSWKSLRFPGGRNEERNKMWRGTQHKSIYSVIDPVNSPPLYRQTTSRGRFRRGVNRVCLCWGQFGVYRKSSAENMPLARRRMESLDASYGCSLDGISNTAGIDCMWASIAWRIISAMNWLMRMMPMSLRAKKLLEEENRINDRVLRLERSFWWRCHLIQTKRWQIIKVITCSYCLEGTDGVKL